MVNEPPTTAADQDDTSHDPWAVAQAMWANDDASQRMGMELIEIGLGRAVIRMPVEASMTNGLDVCHGGFVFTLADSAMAFSSNSHNRHAIATMGEIDWVAAVRAGATLTATATERHRRGKAAVTDVEVVDQDGQLVALFRGRTLQTGGQHLPDGASLKSPPAG